MRVAVIGPTNVARVGDAAGIRPDTYTRAAATVGRCSRPRAPGWSSCRTGEWPWPRWTPTWRTVARS